MHAVGRNEHHRTGMDCVFRFAVEYDALAIENEHFVFIAVRVPRRMPAGGHLELPHGEAWRLIIRPDQAADTASGGPFQTHILRWNRFEMNNLHKQHPADDRIIVEGNGN